MIIYLLLAGVLPSLKGCFVSLCVMRFFSAVLIGIGKTEVRGKSVSDHATKVHKGSRYIARPFLTWAVDGDWWSTTCSRKIVKITVNMN